MCLKPPKRRFLQICLLSFMRPCPPHPRRTGSAAVAAQGDNSYRICAGAHSRQGEVIQRAAHDLMFSPRCAQPRRGKRFGVPSEPKCKSHRQKDSRPYLFVATTGTSLVAHIGAKRSRCLHRLAEAKGAAELLLAECYVRRDQVAVVSFRGKAAETLLAPTRSLVRAKRSLASLPGGGGTPLAAGIDMAFLVADAAQRRGMTPTLVFLTDGRANVARDGTPGRPQAAADALASAKRLRSGGFNVLMIDTSPEPRAAAKALADAMRGRYLGLPYAGAQAISAAVLAQTQASR